MNRVCHISRRNPRYLLCVGLLVAAALLSGGAFAVDQVSSAVYQPAEEVTLRQEDGSLLLDLDEAISIALRRNLGLRVERYRRAESFYGIRQNLGIYDLSTSFLSFSFDETLPAASALEGALVPMIEGEGADLNLTQLTPFGGTVAFDWINRRNEDNSLFSVVNPNYRVDLDLTITQPLLRDFGRTATERNLRVSRTNSAISLENLELEVINTVEFVEFAYWTLVEAREQLKVAEESLDLARELHEMNQVQVEVGTLAPLELIQSEVGVATREEEIIRAQAAVQDAADLLRRLLNLEQGEYWQKEIVPASDPRTEREEIDLDRAIISALAERPEIERQRLQLKNLDLDRRFFRNQKLPQFNVQVRWGTNGLGGDVLLDRADPQGGTIPGSYSDALDQALDSEFKGWSVGLNVGYPIQNRTARAQSTIAKLALEGGQTQLEDLELLITTEVRTAARAVETAAKQIDSAQVSSRLAERNLEAEQKRYENGLSTSFRVLEIQEDLSEARSREVNAITTYRRALVRYFQSIGRLLEENGIELVDEPKAKN